VLNLFAHTGGTTLVAATAGASVAHVDASRPAVAWARRNAELSGLDHRPIRWLVDDALAFARREVRRGRTYQGIVLDPPSYGHAPNRARWHLAEHLPLLLDACARLLADTDAFVLLTAHTPEFGPAQLQWQLAEALGRPAAQVEAGPLEIPARHGPSLPAGVFARFPHRGGPR
jgi:23S rRNA (cytosine1962-C5)-methyltransferase